MQKAPRQPFCFATHVICLQYALDYYPPFASGCGFILSRDLVQALLKQPLPDYRLLVCAQLPPPYSCVCCACSWGIVCAGDGSLVSEPDPAPAPAQLLGFILGWLR